MNLSDSPLIKSEFLDIMVHQRNTTKAAKRKSSGIPFFEQRAPAAEKE